MWWLKEGRGYQPGPQAVTRYEIGDGGGRDWQMLERLERARRRGKVMLFDPGSATFSGAMACWDAEEDDRSSLGRRTVLAGATVVPSRGMGVHGVQSVREFQRGLRDLVERVERRAKRGTVDEVIIAVQSRNLICHHARGDAKISGGEITDRDVLRALSRCARPPGGQQRAILHALPVQFSLDDRDGILEPQGLTGKSIIADIFWVSVDRPVVDELSRCAEACGLKPAGFVAAPYVAGYACMDRLRKGDGYACLDLGASGTGLSVFLKDKCIHCSVLPVGGFNIAARIARMLDLSLVDAERVRRGAGPAGKQLEARRIVEDATIRLFRRVRLALKREDFYQIPGGHVLLTGGGVRDPRFLSVASRILSCPVLPGRARKIWWPSEQATDPDVVILQGLARIVREDPIDLRSLEHAYSGSVVGLMRRTVHWMASNW